ncbi:MAG: PD40 domain-containing protein [Nitrospirae bacterium]|nr:PD40 domain-containing protein [Nitrospirota bacterium]
MNKLFQSASALVAVACVVLFPGAATAKFDPIHEWRTIETAHFLVHFHEGEENLARRAGAIADEVHERLAKRLKWTPSGKTHLIIADDSDAPQGWASVFPNNRFVISAASPVEEGAAFFGLDDWLRLVITHEYTHVLHIDMVSGFPALLRAAFGRLYFPNMFQPEWLVEGYATYEETKGTSGGRGRAAFTEMLLRSAVLEGRFPTLGQMATFPDDWPAGLVPYNFGAKFLEFIAAKVGDEKIGEIGRVYGGRTVPFLVQSSGRRALGVDYGSLYAEWRRDLEKKSRAEAEAIVRTGITPTSRLTRRGEYTIHPAISPDGNRIAYASMNGNEYPSLRLMRSDGSEDRLLVERMGGFGASGMSLAWAPDGKRIYYTKLEMRRSFSARMDVYAYDLDARKESRITRDLRARDPHVSPDGRRLIFSTAEGEKSRLVVLDLADRRKFPAGPGEARVLVESEADRQFANPRWSPDGKRIAVTVFRRGKQDVWVLDDAGKKVAEVTDDRAIEGAPAWSPDGRFVYFSSDRTGVFNVFRFEAASRKIEQVTNVLTGAFSPVLSPDGKWMALAVYSADGFDIHRMDLTAVHPRPAEPYLEKRPPLAPEPVPAAGEARPYSPGSTLLPRWWFPWYSEDEKGGVLWAVTSGQDVLDRHYYLIEAGYGLESGRWAYEAYYQNDALYPTISLYAADAANEYGDLLVDPSGRKSNYWERQRRQTAGLFVPFYRIPYQHGISLSYNRLNMTRLSDPGAAAEAPREGVQAGIKTSWVLDTSNKYRKSISPEDGRRIEVGYEWIDKSLGGDFNIRKATADWHEFIELGSHHVLAVRAFGGTASGDRLLQRAYQLGGDVPGDVTIGTEETTLSLRGYAPDSIRGQKAVLGSLEYRFPLWRIDRGPSTAPFFFRRLHGAVFADTGTAWDTGGLDAGDLKTGVGGEVRFDIYFSYQFPITLRAVLARGVSKGGETQAYLGLWVGY